jgi:hypothetical protein
LKDGLLLVLIHYVYLPTGPSEGDELPALPDVASLSLDGGLAMASSSSEAAGPIKAYEVRKRLGLDGWCPYTYGQ